MKKPKLYIFIVSHFCEKARWALDYFNVGYELIHLPPGVHVLAAKKMGAPGTTVPILKIGKEVIQGSDKIIDWAQENYSSTSKTLLSKEPYKEIEERLDSVIGVHIRRYFYSEALVDYPENVKETFSRHLSRINSVALKLSWKKVRQIMIDSMDLGTDQRLESKQIVEKELSWLEDILSDSRDYLLGDGFSRADLTAASLIAGIARPDEHPVYPYLELPPLMKQDIENWKDRPAIKWVNNIYSRYR